MKPGLQKRLKELDGVLKDTQLTNRVECKNVFKQINELAKIYPECTELLRTWMDEKIVKYFQVPPLEWVRDVMYSNLLEYVWRRCFQIVVWDDGRREDSSPIGFGCGFVIKYQGECLFVTADHVIHQEEHESGVVNSRELTYGLVCNIADRNKWEFLIKQLQGFYYADRFNIDDIRNSNMEFDVHAIPNRIDIAYCHIDTDVVSRCVTHDLSFGDNVVVEPGLSKICIDEKTFAKPNKEHSYIVLGTFRNELEGMLWKRSNAICPNLKYIEEDGYSSELIFKVPENSGIDDWHGLSGSPLFSDDGKLVGMLVRHSKEEGTLRVIPIHAILDFINILKVPERNCQETVKYQKEAAETKVARMETASTVIREKCKKDVCNLLQEMNDQIEKLGAYKFSILPYDRLFFGKIASLQTSVDVRVRVLYDVFLIKVDCRGNNTAPSLKEQSEDCLETIWDLSNTQNDVPDCVYKVASLLKINFQSPTHFYTVLGDFSFEEKLLYSLYRHFFVSYDEPVYSHSIWNSFDWLSQIFDFVPSELGKLEEDSFEYYMTRRFPNFIRNNGLNISQQNFQHILLLLSDQNCFDFAFDYNDWKISIDKYYANKHIQNIFNHQLDFTCLFKKSKIGSSRNKVNKNA